MAAAPPATFAPGPEELRALKALLAPWQALTSPRFEGLDRIPETGPTLFVGNHTIYGLLDVPLMVAGVHEAHGVWLRGLADHFHFDLPGWSTFLARMGAVRGTRENCAALMRAGEHVLVFPGGGREVAKRKGEAYRLLWKERIGFARMAIEHGARVVPFAAVGAEETYRILIDGDHPLTAPLRELVGRVTGRRDMVMPIARGVGPTLLPRPERFYFGFGEPIDVARWDGRHEDPKACRELRDEVKSAVEDGIAELLRLRDADPERELSGRVRAALLR